MGAGVYSYEYLRPLAETEDEAEMLDALASHDGQRAAAAALGISDRTLRYRLARLKLRGTLSGMLPEVGQNKPMPAPLGMTGASIFLKGEDANVWLKMGVDKAQVEALFKEMREAAMEELPRVEPGPGPVVTVPELANVYVVTDYHLGMMAWREEAGTDWDLTRAEEMLMRWFNHAIAYAPDASHAVFAQLGDFLDFDSLLPVTPTNHNVLDVSARYTQVVRVAIRLMRWIIERLLEKHDTVEVIPAEGNHDLSSSVWLREMLAHIYGDHPRVVVDTNPDPWYGTTWGEVALFFHHGHKRKGLKVADTFVAKFRNLYGQTKHAYAHTGNFHFDERVENSLMIVEQHQTLAPKTAHISRAGYDSGRSAKVITYHKQYGEVGRQTISPMMVLNPLDMV